MNRNGRQPPFAFPVLAYGFRPFFLLAGLYGWAAMIAWLLVYLGTVPTPESFPPALLHAHEMLFGFAAATIAGFFLTAVPGWTGGTPVAGARLLALVLLWAAGRTAMWAADVVPPWLVALIDLSFLPALAAAVAPTILRSGAKRNLAFMPVLGLLVAGNALIHLDRLGVTDYAGSLGATLAVDAIAVLIALVGGRIVPAFTRTALAARGETASVATRPPIEGAAIGLTLLVALADAAMLPAVAGVAALAAAVAHALRMSGWQTRKTLGEPILWVLHLGYAWLALGFLVKGLAALVVPLPGASAVHGLAVGAIGTMTLAVMSRAALGHTGRALVAPIPVAVAYLLVSAAALSRVALGLVMPGHYELAVVIAGALWAGAFGLFFAAFWPVLTRPRVDGAPG
ncbi:MAG: NnrS family protein, partial [Alphaproteobacteria bacterium]